ncbi:DUF1963 domain-containing protein [Xanthomonas melonis]|uniref:DUF1963 domain-containing protein n=3 Tax=Xanthomonas melonis TaxID=56456 RepID=A0ABS8NRR1_9XANT|nr:DUF1963 domain-containing protein [Xanthomonas melonis]MCD0265762.1 DUF1963 domain-containing protein [Xanthomonas melonis]
MIMRSAKATHRRLADTAIIRRSMRPAFDTRARSNRRIAMMQRFETAEFSIEADPIFDGTRVSGGSISLRHAQQGTFSPQISVWTAAAERKASLRAWLTRLTRDDDPVIERKPVTFAGMKGEMIKLKGRLEDWDTQEGRDWYRLRVVLVAPDGSTWYHATAMTSEADLAAIEADFMRVLGSLQVKLQGDAASQERTASDAEQAAVLSEIRDAMDRAAEAQSTREQALARTIDATSPHTSVADVQTRFDAAIAMHGLDGKREILRQIVVPSVSLTERDVAETDVVGISRIGGGPDLAQGQDWPRDASGLYLNFLAQIELSDLPERAEVLPEAGLLAFFTGSDYSDWRVVFTPPGTALVAHALPDDAIDITEAATRMVVWDGERQRFVANGTSVERMSVETDEHGRLQFQRDGQTVMVFASEYEISRSARALRLERSLSAPLHLAGSGNPDIDVTVGSDDLFDFALTLAESFKIGDGPQHQMFGVCGIRDWHSIQTLAADHAARQGWTDIAAPDGWFVLLKLASGGGADFNFSDHGDYLFLAHRQDAARGDFSRVYALVESS